MRRRLYGLLAILVLTQPMFAAERVEGGTTLSIDLAKGTITDVKRKEETALLAVNTFTIRRNETVKIEILQNLALFTYEVKSVKTDTPEYVAALEFAKQLQSLLALFPAPRASGVARTTIRGVDPDPLRQALEQVLELIEKLPTDLAATLSSPDQVAALKKKWAEIDIEALARRIDEGYTMLTRVAIDCANQTALLRADDGRTISCNGPVALLTNANLTRQMQELQALDAEIVRLDRERSGIEALISRDSQALTDVAKKDKAKAQGLIDNIAKLRASLQGLDVLLGPRESERKQKRESLDADLEVTRSQPTLLSLADTAGATYGKITAHLATLQAFSDDVAGLGKGFLLATVPHSIKIDTETIEIKGSSKYDKFLDTATRKKRDAQLRKFDVALKPYQPAHLSVAPAFVLGFIRNPEFTTVKDGDTFKIQKKDDELNRYTVGIMMNITPDSWQEPTFGGHFQVGVSPVKDNLGFLLGAGIRAQNLFSFGAGVMLQQVRTLAGDLTLDTRLDDPAKLKTEREFKRGLYLHVTVDIPK